jgi:hypothetical protein
LSNRFEARCKTQLTSLLLLYRAVPLNVDFVIHRNGEWMMLMLGENILSLLIVDVEHEGKAFYTIFYCGLLTVILLQLLHFQSQPHEADLHAMRRSKNRGIIWGIVQNVYSLALVTLSASFSFFVLFSDDSNDRELLERRLATEVDEGSVRREAANLFSGALAVIFLSLDVMNLLHLGTEEILKRSVVENKVKIAAIFACAMRVGVIVFTGTISQWTENPKHITMTGLLCVIGELTMRKFGLIYLKDSQSTIEGAVTNNEKENSTPNDDDESLEAPWPNVMHARAQPEME